MKKWIPYFFGALALLGFLLWWLGSTPSARRPDERITLREGDRIPYGCYLFRQMLPALYPEADVFTEPGAPGDWAGLKRKESNQVLIMPAIRPEPEVEEWKALFSFVRQGNTVLLITATLPAVAEGELGISIETLWEGVRRDSQRYALSHPPFPRGTRFPFFGPRYTGGLKGYHPRAVRVLARTPDGDPQFVEIGLGRGKLLLHLAPLGFSNYFLLQGNNRQYAEWVLSLLPPEPRRIAWSEYLLERNTGEDKREPDFFGVMMRYRAFRMAAWTAGITLLLFLLLGWRRRQRAVAPPPPLTDRTAGYVRTVGNLYYQQRDDAALGRKMADHFISATRDRYNIRAPFPSPQFGQALAARSGYPQPRLAALLKKTEEVQGGHDMSAADLKQYYIELEAFYGYDHRYQPANS